MSYEINDLKETCLENNFSDEQIMSAHLKMYYFFNPEKHLTEEESQEIIKERYQAYIENLKKSLREEMELK